MSVIGEILEAAGEAAAVRGEPRAVAQLAAVARILEPLGRASLEARQALLAAGRPTARTAAFLAERAALIETAVEALRAIESLDANELALHHRQAVEA